MNKKTFLSVLLAVCMILATVTALSGCGGGGSSSNDNATGSAVTEESTSAGVTGGSDGPADVSTSESVTPSDSTADGAKLAAIKSEGALYMYTNAEFPPYEYIGEGGQTVGVDVEIGKAIADKLGVELKVEEAPFDSIVSAIASGKGDVAITGLTITDERKQNIDFSVPYVDSVQYLIVPNDSTITTIESLKDLKVGAQTGTTGEMLLSDEIKDGALKGTKSEVAQYTSAPVAMEGLKTNRVDAVIIDEQVAKQIAAQNDGYKAIPANYENGNPMTEQYGVGIKKGNEDLLKVIDEVVSGLVAEGKIAEWMEKYSVNE